MNRRQLIAEVESLGYEHARTTKNGHAIYRHPETDNSVTISGTTGDRRQWRECLADARRGAPETDLTQGIQQGEGILAQIVKVLMNSSVPMKSEEIVFEVTKLGRKGPSVQNMISKAPDYHENVFKLKRGWYVYDQRIAELEPTVIPTVIDQIAKAGPRRAYREPTIVEEALDLGADLMAEQDVPIPVPSDPVPSTEDDTPTVAPVPIPKPYTAAQERSVELMEIIAREPGLDIVVLSDESGRLWVARPIAAIAPKGIS